MNENKDDEVVEAHDVNQPQSPVAKKTAEEYAAAGLDIPEFLKRTETEDERLARLDKEVMDNAD